MKSSFLYCARNVALQYQTGNNKARDCDGPYGSGIETSCLGECTQACDTRKKLITMLGTSVLNYLEI